MEMEQIKLPKHNKHLTTRLTKVVGRGRQRTKIRIVIKDVAIEKITQKRNIEIEIVVTVMIFISTYLDIDTDIDTDIDIDIDRRAFNIYDIDIHDYISIITIISTSFN